MGAQKGNLKCALRHAELRNQSPAQEPTVTRANYVLAPRATRRIKQAILDEAALYQEERLRVARTTYHYNCQRLRITASGHGIGIERARFGLMFDRVKSSADSYMAHLQEFIRDRFVAWSLGEQVAQWRRDREAERRVIRVLQRQYLREQTLLRAHVSYDITCQYAQNNCLLSSLMSHEIQAVAPPGNLAADDVYACCALPFFPGRAFKGHDQHSAHANRYYYVIESGAYSSLTACLAALSLAPEPTPPVRVSTAEQAGHAWWSICRDRHPHCQARHAVAVTQPLQKATPHARRAPSLRMVGFTAVFKPHRPTRPQAHASPNSTSSSSRLSDSESGTSSSSRRSGTVTSSTGSSLDATPAPIAPFLFVVVKTGAIYFDAYVSVLIAPTPNINGSLFSQEAHAESRRVGAKKFNPTNNDSVFPPWIPFPHPDSMLLDGSLNISTQGEADQWQMSQKPWMMFVVAHHTERLCRAGWTSSAVPRGGLIAELRSSNGPESSAKKRVAAICERRERGLARLSRVSPHLLPTHTDTNTVSSAAEARLAREQEADAQARRERVEYVETLRRAGLAKQQAAKSTRGLTGKSLLDVRKAVCEWENDKVLFPAENIRPSDTVCLAVEGEALQVVTALPAKRATSRVRVLRRETGDHNELVQSRDEADAVHEFLKLVFKIALRSVSGGSNEGWSDIRLGSVGHPKSCPDGARDIGCLHVETCYVGGRLADESEGYGGSEIVVGLGIVKFHSDNGSRSDEDGEVLRRSSDLLEGGEKFPVTDIDGVMVEITKSERGYALLATKKLDHIVDYRGPGRENFQGLGGCKIVDETDYIN
ncbi:hypothetical protein C8R43DRAFT_960498 [Mycena crocata]|nr:hypothetical protein C8R43DRAFT_960498 [Mycena crocata]